MKGKNTKPSEFGKPGTCKFPCRGRSCAKCYKCRDWHYTGDEATWKWIQTCENWGEKDWNRWNSDRVWELFTKRDGATCDVGVYVRFDFRGFGYGFGH
ncbi:unnamed protein product, partial [Rotaria sp. Silwood1]